MSANVTLDFTDTDAGLGLSCVGEKGWIDGYPDFGSLCHHGESSPCR